MRVGKVQGVGTYDGSEVARELCLHLLRPERLDLLLKLPLALLQLGHPLDPRLKLDDRVQSDLGRAASYYPETLRMSDEPLSFSMDCLISKPPYLPIGLALVRLDDSRPPSISLPSCSLLVYFLASVHIRHIWLCSLFVFFCEFFPLVLHKFEIGVSPVPCSTP